MPKRWAVERTFAWTNKCRRLSKINRLMTTRPNACATFDPIRQGPHCHQVDNQKRKAAVLDCAAGRLADVSSQVGAG